ncbi:MAG: TnpV protein, partial [Candidatus Saccharibacteria bacterium]|nr:TnpV protein [Candidatus Saccharibacteria bacterium]
KKHRRTGYAVLLTSGKLNDYLADLNEQAEGMFSRLVNELAERDGITEKQKATDQMKWVQRMNAVRQTATEIVNNDLIYT